MHYRYYAWNLDKIDDVSLSYYYRNRLRHALLFRKELSHRSASSSPAACLAFVLALRDVLKDHEQPVGQFLPITEELRSLMDMRCGDVREKVTIHPEMFILLASDVLLRDFASAVGEAVNHFLKPTPLREVTEVTELVRILRKPTVKGGPAGRNQQLLHWPAYWGSASTPGWDCRSVADALEFIVASVHRLNHRSECVELASLQRLLDCMRDVYNTLRLGSGRLNDWAAAVGSLPQSADPWRRAAVHVDCTEDPGPERISGYISGGEVVGRKELIGQVADDFRQAQQRGQPWRVSLTGIAGTGKTVLAHAVCEELLDALPVQHMLNAGTLGLELARLGRAFVPGLQADDADGEASQRFLEHLASTTGWLLLVDDVAEPLSLRPLLPATGYVLFTSEQRLDLWPEDLCSNECNIGCLTTEQSIELLLQVRKTVGKLYMYGPSYALGCPGGRCAC